MTNLNELLLGRKTSKGAGDYSSLISNILSQALETNAQHDLARSIQNHQKLAVINGSPVERALFESRAFSKVWTAQVAMHLNGDWREKFFWQIDNLLDEENWEEGDLPMTQESFKTLLRMMTLQRGMKRPGLGLTSEGNAIATWTNGDRRLTVECYPGDQVRWVLSVREDGQPESAAGKTSLPRLLKVLAPYSPELWFFS